MNWNIIRILQNDQIQSLQKMCSEFEKNYHHCTLLEVWGCVAYLAEQKSPTPQSMIDHEISQHFNSETFLKKTLNHSGCNVETNSLKHFTTIKT